MDREKEALLAALPDEPGFVEARGLLRRARSRVIGDGSGFVLAPEHELAVAFGDPGSELVDQVADAARSEGLSQLELHGPEATARRWAEAGLGIWLALAQVLRWAGPPSGGLAGLVRHEARHLAPDDEALETLPRTLRSELDGIAPWPMCAASFAGGSIASLAYAFVETETLWDVSIDTLPAFRREGFATASAAHLIMTQLGRGLRPVWGAESTNTASLSLARRLGFEPDASIGILRVRDAR